jgi:hypothetical protein
MALGIVPGDPDSTAKVFVDLKIEQDKEKAVQIVAQIEINVLTLAVKDLKISADRFANRIPTLKHQVKHCHTQF